MRVTKLWRVVLLNGVIKWSFAEFVRKIATQIGFPPHYVWAENNKRRSLCWSLQTIPTSEAWPEMKRLKTL